MVVKIYGGLYPYMDSFKMTIAQPGQLLFLDGTVARILTRSRALRRFPGTSGWRYPLHKARMTFYFGGSDTDLNSQASFEALFIRSTREGSAVQTVVRAVYRCIHTSQYLS